MREHLFSGMKFSLPELAGSVGDFGTILPLILAVSLAAGLNIGYIFLFFGLWFTITGFLYKLPIPIEPMKVIAVIALAENLGAGQIAAAGLILGILFLALGSGRWLDLLEKWIPTSVIRGIQLGLALLLLRTSGTFFLSDPIVFAGALGLMAAVWLIARYLSLPDISAILLVIIAFGFGILVHGIPPLTLLPFPSLILPSLTDLPHAAADLVVPQALLTITNAILATTLLTRDLFSRDVPAARLSRTIGLMNLTSVPFGGFPMCHGAGGLAAQYRFGARTGGANVYAGFIFLILAFLFASPSILSLVSVGFFGAMLVFVALELGRHSLKTDSILVTGGIGILSLATSMTLAFVVGMALAYGIPRIGKRLMREDKPLEDDGSGEIAGKENGSSREE